MEWDWSYDSNSLHLSMSSDFLGRIARDCGLQNDQPLPLTPFFRELDHGLASLLEALRTESAEQTLGADLVTSSLLMLIGVRVLRAHKRKDVQPEGTERSARPHEARLHRCIERLHDAPEECVSLADLAADCQLSPFHFARVFKRVTGHPPHEYQLRLRVQRARELLRARPAMTVSEIAANLGFSDESHLRRHFKRIVGTTPARFRAEQ
jgi:AraC family transcriptional regulator